MSNVHWSKSTLLVVLSVVACADRDPLHDDGPPVPVPGHVTTAMGTGTQGYDGDGRAPHQSWLNQPTEIVFDPSERLTVVDWNSHRIRRVTDAGRVETVIGVDFPGDWPVDTPLDGALPAAELALNHPMDLAFTAGGSVLVAAWHNHKLLELSPETEDVRVVAGANRPGYAGDGAAPSTALLNFPDSIAIAADGAILFSDERNNVVRRIDAERTAVMTVAGLKAPPTFAGDGGPAIAAGLALSPYDEGSGADNPGPGGALALDDDGALYIADTYDHCVRRVAPGPDGLVGQGDPSEETIETFAGTCEVPGFLAGATGSTLLLRQPHDVEVADGALFVADTGNHVVWRIDLVNREPTLVVGTGATGNGPEGARPLDVSLDHPYGIAFDSAGNLYVADTLNNRVRVLWK